MSNPLKRRMLWLLSIFSLLAIMAAFVVQSTPTAHAYPSGVQKYQFYMYSDGNGNNVPDANGYDTCRSNGRTMALYDVDNSLTYYVTVNARADFLITNYTDLALCVTGSSIVYTLYAPGHTYSLLHRMSTTVWDTIYSDSPVAIYGWPLKLQPGDE